MLSKITGDILDKIIEEIRKPENMTRIQIGVIDPVIKLSFDKLYPYILVSAIIFLLTFLLAITILLLVIRSQV